MAVSSTSSAFFSSFVRIAGGGPMPTVLRVSLVMDIFLFASHVGAALHSARPRTPTDKQCTFFDCG